jgi:hypothetical protein
LVEAVTDANLETEFTGLAYDTQYWAAAQVGGRWHRVSFRTERDTSVDPATQGYVAAVVGALTKASVGLPNVDNTSDVNKPVSTAAEARLAPVELGQVGGIVAAENYGASTSGTAAANATAIHAARDALGARGGIILFGLGDYAIDTLDFDDTRSIILQGLGGLSGGASTATRLVYAGTGTAISAKSSFGFVMRDMALQFTNAAHSGELVDLTHSAAALDTSYATFDRCLIGSGSAVVSGTGTLVSLDLAIICNFNGCAFNGGNHAVAGPLSGANYSNDITFNGCTFVNFASAAVRNPVYGWNFVGCTFQQKVGGNAGAILSSGGPVARNLLISGGGFWDANGSGTWVDVDVRGLTIQGAVFGAGDKAVNLQDNAAGVNIHGNQFDTQTTTAIALGAAINGFRAHGNHYIGSGARITGSPQLHGLVAAATAQLGDEDQDVFVVSGTDAISDITPKRTGRLITLVSSGTHTVSDSANLALAGNWTPAGGNETLTLRCADTVWYEVARSAN